MLEVEEGVLSVKQNLSNLDQSVIHYKPGPGTLHAQDFVAYSYIPLLYVIAIEYLEFSNDCVSITSCLL